MSNELLLVLEEAAARWRKQAGELSCKFRGVGPTGGFCLDPAKKLSGDAGCMPVKLAARLGNLFYNKSVLDFGAGAGLYGRYFAKHAPTVRWVGVDGADNVEVATDGRVRFAELTDVLPSWIHAAAAGTPTSMSHAIASTRHASSTHASSSRQASFDWAMSLEVGEHVARSAEPRFMHNLVSSSREGIVLSWARLGQGGTDHVNCQSTAYVACAMRLLGWANDEPTQQRLRAAVGRHFHDCGWLRTSLQVFRPLAPWTTPADCARASASGAGGGADDPALCPLPAAPTRRFIQAYHRATRSSCPHTVEGCNTTLFPYDMTGEQRAAR